MALPRVMGILALQGDFEKHARMFAELEVSTRMVKTAGELDGLSGLVIPGGESTTMTKLMSPELRTALLKFCSERPVWGTCAGMIMLSKDASDPRVKPLGLLDVEIVRNGYGRQVFSFEAELKVADEVGEADTPLHGMFIRAPRLTRLGEHVRPLAWLNDEPVCVRQDHFLASAFHPELTNDSRLHRYFLSMAV
jgi:pyridoxal 5'-phosphate synthase pdxT subunit